MHRGGACDLEREPALPRPAGPGDGHEPHVGSGEEALDGGEIRRAADQPMVECRQRGPGERAQRGEVGGEAVADELEERLRVGDVLQPVAAERLEGDRWHRLLARELAGRLRDDDLVAVAGAADPRRDVDVESDVALVDELGLARVEADPHPQNTLRRPPLPADRALEVDGGRDRVPGAGEDEKRAVPGPVHLVPVPTARRLAHELPQARADRPVTLSERVQEPRRALDVGEEERDRPGRQPPR